MNYAELKTRQRAERHAHPPNLALRVHRAISWLHRAELQAAQGDKDGEFIFLWIAFNAAYATTIDDRIHLDEQRTFRAFLQKLVDLDGGRARLTGLVWEAFPGPIRVLLDNPYLFQDFWNFHNGTLAEDEWKRRFEAAKRVAKLALANRDTVTVLGVALSRIYTLRNQLMHGGATWNSSVNRDQIRDCTALLGRLVPVVIEVMLDHPETLWGDACYPVVE
jgi:hypothetical protein